MAEKRGRGKMRDGGVLTINGKVPLRDDYILSLVYTPGVAEPCLEIAAHPERVDDFTSRGNLIAVVSDGSAVLSYGNVGPGPALPIMEGMAVLMKTLGGVDALPLVLSTQDPDEIVETIRLLTPTFGGFLLEDIESPKCFDIEKRLIETLDVPVSHSDQHGSAIHVLAALINAFTIVGKTPSSVKVVICGAGAAGIATARLLLTYGIRNIVLVDSAGIIHSRREQNMNHVKEAIAMVTNPAGERGSLSDAVRGADVLVGLSRPKLFTAAMISSMAKEPIVFSLANPVPEITPEEAKAAGATVVASGMSGSVNRMLNPMVNPGIFRGALDVRARSFNQAMYLAAAEALAGIVSPAELKPDYIVPRIMDLRITPAIAAAVAKTAIINNLARKIVNPEEIAERSRRYLYRQS
jgi:malate dehydrogenase (oxaloacetate-decarboxylating)